MHCFTRTSCRVSKTLNRTLPDSANSGLRFEGPPTATTKIRISYGSQCVWTVHARIFRDRCYHGPFEEHCWGREHEDSNVELMDEGTFIFARLLQFLYYGTYSYRCDDLVAAGDNIARPGHPGISPATIVRLGLSDPNNPNFATMKAQDDTTAQDFGYDIHLTLFKMATKYGIADLHDYALERYSAFQFRNHREFHHSVIDHWPTFPHIEDTYRYHDILRAVLVHIAKYWGGLHSLVAIPPRVEAREILGWVKGDSYPQRLLMDWLLKTLAGVDIDEQEKRENPCRIEDCTSCGGSSKDEWSDSNTERSSPY